MNEGEWQPRDSRCSVLPLSHTIDATQSSKPFHAHAETYTKSHQEWVGTDIKHLPGLYSKFSKSAMNLSIFLTSVFNIETAKLLHFST